MYLDDFLSALLSPSRKRRQFLIDITFFKVPLPEGAHWRCELGVRTQHVTVILLLSPPFPVTQPSEPNRTPTIDLYYILKIVEGNRAPSLIRHCGRPPKKQSSRHLSFRT